MADDKSWEGDGRHSGNRRKGEQSECISGTGVVTVLEGCLPKGVIDGMYFFDKSLAASDIKKGSNVEFSATLSQDTMQWEVTSIKLVITEVEIEKANRRKFITIVGKVTSIENDFAMLKYGKSFEDEVQQIPVAALPQNYRVWRGDYLRVKIELNNVDDEKAGGKIISVEPTSKKTLVGQIMNSNGRLSIENYIYLDQDACHNRRFPAVQECVRVVAIESDQGIYSWRAVSVSPSNFNLYTAAGKESEGWLSHDNSWKDSLRELTNDKCGVTIQPTKSLSFARVKIGSSITRSIEIQNNSDHLVNLKAVVIKGDQSVCRFIVDESKREFEDSILTIEPNRVKSLNITCHPEMMGSTRELALFEFGSFRIGRYLTMTALSKEVAIIDEMKMKEAGNREWRNVRSDVTISKIVEDSTRPVVRGIQPIRPPFFLQKRIANNPVPKYMWHILQNQDEADLVRRHPGVGEVLRIENYLEKFRVSLWLEEMENAVLRRQYDLENIILRRAGDYFAFEVPGLKDIHPPILIGDPITAYDIADQAKTKYEAYIYDVRGNDVYAKFSDQLKAKYEGTFMTIQFCISRTTYKRCHHAIEQAVRLLGEDWLFPEVNIICQPPRILYIEIEEDQISSEEAVSTTELKTSDCENITEFGATPKLNLFSKRPSQSSPRVGVNGLSNQFRAQGRTLDRRIPSMKCTFKSDTEGPCGNGEPLTLKWFNRMLNREQKDAVRRILRGQGRPLPYIIFGPPGTGKTVTIVEAILQVYKLDKNSRTLVVAPSNSAADVIAQNLVVSKEFGIGDFVRLVGFLRQDSQIPENIRDYCNDGEYLDAIARHRLIVCTCTTAGQFFHLGLDTGHFTHVFIDEAGYSTEPEAIIAASLVALDKSGQVILAGDPKQLGPVLMSDVAAKCGLSLSLLERLMSRPFYSRNEEKFPIEKYNPVVLTKLVKNYRAHPTLLKLPSKLFYDDELEAAVSEETVNLCHSLDFLKDRGTPVLFHGIQGQCSKDRDSPSWFNAAEVIQVFEYVRLLRAHGLSNDDIGIITPYRKQVEKLRKALELGLLTDEIPKVGSVEEFQGGERKVMIMSLVRSAMQKDLEKVIDRFSFVFSPKRFNVAVTRAKAVLIVVGNPHVLVYDEIWLTFIKYCIDLGAYRGCDLPLEVLHKSPQKYLKDLGAKVAQYLTHSPIISANGGKIDYNSDGEVGESDVELD